MRVGIALTEKRSSVSLAPEPRSGWKRVHAAAARRGANGENRSLLPPQVHSPGGIRWSSLSLDVSPLASREAQVRGRLEHDVRSEETIQPREQIRCGWETGSWPTMAA